MCSYNKQSRKFKLTTAEVPQLPTEILPTDLQIENVSHVAQSASSVQQFRPVNDYCHYSKFHIDKTSSETREFFEVQY